MIEFPITLMGSSFPISVHTSSSCHRTGCHSYRVIFEENMTPLILDKEEKGDDTDDHGAGYEGDDNQATIHHSYRVTQISYSKYLNIWCVA